MGTISTAFKGGKKYLANEVAGNEVILFLRHPIDRQVSGFRWFHDLGEPHAKDYETWVDYLLAGPDDIHVIPVTARQQPWVVTQLYRFEDMPALWPKLFDVPMPHVNASRPHPVNDYRAEEITEFYRADLDLWMSI